MPFDKFVDIETLQQERRQAVHQSLREITLEELKKVVNESLSDFEGDPWQTNFLRIIEEHPQGSFYHAVTREGALLLYCRGRRRRRLGPSRQRNGSTARRGETSC